MIWGLPVGGEKHEFFVKQTWNVGETAGNRKGSHRRYTKSRQRNNISIRDKVNTSSPTFLERVSLRQFLILELPMNRSELERNREIKSTIRKEI